MNRNIFSSRSPLKVNMLFAAGFSVLLLFIDAAFPAIFNFLQNAVKFSFDPLYVASDLTSKASDLAAASTRSKSELLAEIDRLKRQQLLDQVKLQKLTQLEIDTAQYQQWLHLPNNKAETLSLAQVIGHAVDMTSHVLIINKGSKHGVRLGQFAIDMQGLMGQITEVYPFTSRFMLLSDKHHAVSVRNQRTGMLAILSGTGDSAHLALDYVPATADIKQGDVLLTSGLGGRFNAGYPAGIVAKIKTQGKSEFSEITVNPIAALQGSTLVALIDYVVPTVIDNASVLNPVTPQVKPIFSISGSNTPESTTASLPSAQAPSNVAAASAPSTSNVDGASTLEDNTDVGVSNGE